MAKGRNTGNNGNEDASKLLNNKEAQRLIAETAKKSEDVHRSIIPQP